MIYRRWLIIFLLQLTPLLCSSAGTGGTGGDDEELPAVELTTIRAGSCAFLTTRPPAPSTDDNPYLSWFLPDEERAWAEKHRFPETLTLEPIPADADEEVTNTQMLILALFINEKAITINAHGSIRGEIKFRSSSKEAGGICLEVDLSNTEEASKNLVFETILPWVMSMQGRTLSTGLGGPLYWFPSGISYQRIVGLTQKE